MANKLLEKMKKEKAFLDVLEKEHKEDEWLSTNCISVNSKVLFISNQLINTMIFTLRFGVEKNWV